MIVRAKKSIFSLLYLVFKIDNYILQKESLFYIYVVYIQIFLFILCQVYITLKASLL